MLTLMTARCDQCGHENNPEYRFCGVCGAPLPPVVSTREPAREPQRTRVSPVGGPSFLGLGDDRSPDLDYLLDDEPPRGHGRLYLALLLLVLSGGLLAWHWQRDGYPWAGLVPAPAASPTPANSLPASAQPPVPATQPPANPTPPETQSPTGATGEGVQPAAAEPPPEGQVSPSPITVVKPSEQTPESPAGPQPTESTAKPSTAPAAETGEPDATESSPAAKENPVAKEAPEPAAPTRKSTLTKPSPTVSPARPEDRLVDEGEKYLYGHGARANCDLARRNLFIGAQQSNAKAQTLLGAMYATGHCVNRDLPTAYRWFAKALHGDPSNSRVQRDLEVLWKQMTPEERQLAMKSQ